MAVVFCDGFEQYSTSSHFSGGSNQGQYVCAPTASYGWVASTGSTIIADSTVKRTTQTSTSKSLKLGSSAGLLCKAPAPASLIVGFGFYVTSLSSTTSIVTFSDNGSFGADLGLRVRVLTTGALDFYNELTNTSIVSSATGLISANTWYYIELKVIFGVAGSVEARINESSVCSQGVVDTLCGSASMTCMHLMNSAGNTVYFDDLYLCDATGSTNNNYLGAIGVYTLFPTANGTTNNFSVTGAASNAAAVNNASAVFSSYVSSSTSGDTDLFTLQSLPVALSTVNAVMVAGRIQNVSAPASATQQLGIRTSGVELYGSSQKGTTGDWLNVQQVFETQADGSIGWTDTAVNSMQAGIKNS